MKKLLISLIKIYQRILSPDQGLLRYFYVNNRQHCAMHPTCSSYMILAIEKYGPLRGFLKGIWRIFRCNPFQKNFIDFP